MVGINAATPLQAVQHFQINNLNFTSGHNQSISTQSLPLPKRAPCWANADKNYIVNMKRSCLLQIGNGNTIAQSLAQPP